MAATGAGPILDRLEAQYARTVAGVLADVADAYARQITEADGDLTAAYDVAGIRDLWAARLDQLLAPLLEVYDRAVGWLATGMGAPVPAGWLDLPTVPTADLPAPVRAYLEAEREVLAGVGDRLAATARAQLAAGLAAGETPEELTARLLTAFNATEGAQLGESRAQMIAETEATRAWNTAAVDAAHALPEDQRPQVKQWRTRGDGRVRAAHRAANGQLRLLDEPFNVGGAQMQQPGDPSAPLRLTIRCRCTVAFAHAETDLRTETSTPDVTSESQEPSRAEFSDARETTVDQQTGAMIALVPTEADAARLALDGGAPPGELHLTLLALGVAEPWTADQRTELTRLLRDRAEHTGPITARLFGAAHWNPASDDPAWVWSAEDDRDTDGPRLADAHALALDAMENTHERPELPAQYTPWAPHVTAVYSPDPALLGELEARLGPITFDRLRVAFAGEYTDIQLSAPEPEPVVEAATDTADATELAETVLEAPANVATWTTPAPAALAYESQETGDGRLVTPGALYWEGAGPWPLQYADQMLEGHEGAELAGAIEDMERDAPRITGAGVLYLDRPAGWEAAHLLAEGAPLGVSVDLDNVDLEVLDRTTTDAGDGELVLTASLSRVSAMRLPDGGWHLTATTPTGLAASGTTVVGTSRRVQLYTGPGGQIAPRAAGDLAAALGATLTPAGAALAASAGDPDPGTTEGRVVHTQRAGELLMRITRGRVRGATLVSMPAYATARIVLTDAEEVRELFGLTASASPAVKVTARQVAGAVATAAHRGPSRPAALAASLGAPTSAVTAALTAAVKDGRLVRHGPAGYLPAAASGDLSLPISADTDGRWDIDAAATRVLQWATRDGRVSPSRLGRAFLYRHPDHDAATLDAYGLMIADVIDGELRIVPAAVTSAALALTMLPPGDAGPVRERIEDLYARLSTELDDPTLRPPWHPHDQDPEGDADGGLMASMWRAMQQAPPMPAAWFAEPTREELPPGSGAIHVKEGRIWGWVAQAGEPHAGFPGQRLTIESLGDIDLSRFLRQRFELDDGSSVRVGTITMNVGHHRDGAECETAACQYDDTRTVAGIVTVGMNERGMWFAGAAAPWLSTWDQQVFKATQLSYHMQQGDDGRWQLRAVLSVPVPGHASPLTAADTTGRTPLPSASELLVAAVAERAHLALTAAAAIAPPPPAVPAPRSATAPDTSPPAAAKAAEPHGDSAELTAEIAALRAALTNPAIVDALAAALDQRATDRRAEADRLAAALTTTR